MSHAIVACARDYSVALYGALLSAGVDAKQAGDCARNVAGPLASLPELDVLHVVHERLGLQVAFGYQGSNADRWRAAQACTRVPRFLEHVATASGVVWSPGAE